MAADRSRIGYPRVRARAVRFAWVSLAPDRRHSHNSACACRRRRPPRSLPRGFRCRLPRRLSAPHLPSASAAAARAS
uniref:Uncharacterized protein n=1 Tax=Setaria italica TaxID=4555 RepID=K3ZKR2_SETIT